MSFDDGQHIASDYGRVSVICSMVGFLGNEFVVELCQSDSTGQCIGGLIQKRHIHDLQTPQSSRDFIAAKNIYDRSGMSNT